jgi:hypothetical protein
MILRPGVALIHRPKSLRLNSRSGDSGQVMILYTLGGSILAAPGLCWTVPRQLVPVEGLVGWTGVAQANPQPPCLTPHTANPDCTGLPQHGPVTIGPS